MRLSVVEKMFRDQYCMRDCDQVDVEFLSTNSYGVSEFVIKDYVTQRGHTTLSTSILKIGIIHQKTEILF